MKNLKKKHRDLAQLFIGFAILIVLNMLGGWQFERFDLTAEKRYSLSDSTKKIIKNLDDVVFVKVYLEGEFPAGMKRLRNATQEMLDELQSYGGENIQYQFINPFADPDPKAQEEMYIELTDAGLMPTRLTVNETQGLSENFIFPGAIVSYGGRQVPVQLLKSQFNQNSESVLQQSIENLEYEFATAIYKLRTIDKRPKVAFSMGHGELEKQFIYDIASSLSDFYELEQVELKNDLDIINASTKVLIIAKPDSAFDDASKFIIDQYIMNGGRVLWLLDMVYANLDSMRTQSYTLGLPNDLNLYDQLFKYGVRVNSTLVQDVECAPIVINTGNYGNQPKEEVFSWYYSPVVVPQGQHPLVKNLNAIKFDFAGTIDTIKSPGIEKSILLTSSELSKVMYAPVRISLNIIEQKPTKEKFNKGPQNLAVLLEGTFPSAFTNRIVPTSQRPFVNKSKPTKMIVVSDGDIIKNKYSKRANQPIPLGLDPTTGVYYSGNKTFLLNAVNYLSDDGWFIPLRSKEFKVRLLDKQKINDQKLKWQIINIALPALLVIVFGVIYNYLRKRRFAS